MATPEVVIGAALLSLFVYSQVALGFTTLLIAHVMFSISFVVIVVRSRLIGFDRSLEEAARDLGADAVDDVPDRHPAADRARAHRRAALLAFALSIDDFVISNFNSGTTVTFPLFIFGAAQRGIPVEVNVAGDDALPRHGARDGLVDLAAAAGREARRGPPRRRGRRHGAARRRGRDPAPAGATS